MSTITSTSRSGAKLDVRWLGRIDFAEALDLQEKIVGQKRGDPGSPDILLLLEHDPVYTIGRTPDQTSLRGATHLPHPLFQINRGGQATYHGPGQLIGYPDHRSAELRTGFAQISALDRGVADRVSNEIQHSGAAARRSYRCLGRGRKNCVDRRRGSPLDHDARFRSEHLRRSFAFRSHYSVRNRQRHHDVD